MDTQALQAFVTVAETGSFSIAAEKLHLTQPAISKRIATLEAQLDTRLFDRISRSISLTEAGQLLLIRAEKILQEVNDAIRAVHDLSGDVSGRLALATSHHIGLHRLPSVLRKFSTQHPHVKLDIDFMDSEAAHENILAGKLELAVVTLAPQNNPHLHAEKIWHDPLVFMVAPNHPLLETNNITLRDLSHYPAVLPSTNTYTGQIVLELFRTHQLNLELTLATNYLETIRMMVSIGLGWSVLPATMLDKDVCSINVENIILSRDLGCVWHRNKSLSNAAVAFMAALKSV